MKLRALTFALIAGLTSAVPVRALSISLLSSDDDFLTTFPAAVWTKELGANVRWGNNAGNGDWEMAIVNGSDIPVPGAQRQGVVSGTRAFSFSYANGNATLGLGGFTSAVATGSDPEINTVMIRAKASGSGNVASLANLSLAFGSDVYALGNLIGDSNANYLVLQDTRFSGVWSLLADGTLLSGGSARGSNPMYQLKIGTAEVPDSASTFALVASGLLGAILIRRRVRGGKL
jgi:hypothetical protein